MTDTAAKQNTVQSVGHAFDILACFEQDIELGITELAQRTNLSKSTVPGLVSTLEPRGMLEQTENSRYRLGLSLFELGNLVAQRMDARREALPWCRKLADKYRTTVHLVTLSEDEVIYTDKIDYADAFVGYSRIGRRGPMYCTGVGKAILAFLPEDEREEYLRTHRLERFTANTVTDPDILRDLLVQIRRDGYAHDNEEIEDGLHCVAVPILDRTGRPQMALSISFPYGRYAAFDPNEIAHDILEAGVNISRRLGYHSITDKI